MLFAKSRDYTLRKKFSFLEYKIKVNKFIFINLLNNSTLNLDKSILLETLYENKKKLIFFRNSKVRLVRTCLLTKRRKNVSKTYSLCRNKLKELMLFGVVPGSRKAVW